ncbi:MAG: hypothetical protein OQK78_01800, partial [Gammaproteobacteria bacterium]|nr:hypothetical protein [Gammaproteobacteria bacterium]
MISYGLLSPFSRHNGLNKWSYLFMGVVLALILIPTFLAVAGLSVFIANRCGGREQTIPESRKIEHLNNLGFIFAILLTILLTWLVPEDSNHGWNQLIARIAVVIFTPLVVGVTLLFVRFLLKFTDPPAFASGILLAAIATPFVVPFAFWSYDTLTEQLGYNSLCKDTFL